VARVTTAWCNGEVRQAGRGCAGCVASSMESIGRRHGEAPVAWRPPAATPTSPLPLLLVLSLLLLVWQRRKWKTPIELGFRAAAEGDL
jgi:hypothetical protein